MFTEYFFSVCNCVYFLLLRPIYKWTLHQLTGQCELLRLTAGPSANRQRGVTTKNIEKSLKLSKQLKSSWRLIQNAEDANVDDISSEIATIKNIKPQLYPRFESTMKVFLNQLCGYRLLMADVEKMRKIIYTDENQNHEASLMKLWANLMPNTPLESRITKQWTDIGFQGDDPKTDFRGMGLLGLNNLVHFSTNYKDQARQLLSHSNHPQTGYSFAIVGINITSLTYDLLMKGHLKTHLYNVIQGAPDINHFHYVYCYLFTEFDQFWIDAKPENIMQFNEVREKFESKMIELLEDNSTCFKLNFQTSSDC
ncbi:ELMO domain-containing protein 2-like [Tubulanus polymorphus]|uniref:ELMO domain-containing protein 2-like n=1 Tax=Tubulanus polymorphus TaxID=672921 RepID=UPI003DA46448